VLIVAGGLVTGRLVAPVEDGRRDSVGPALLVDGPAHEQQVSGVAMQRHDSSGEEIPGEHPLHEGCGRGGRAAGGGALAPGGGPGPLFCGLTSSVDIVLKFVQEIVQRKDTMLTVGFSELRANLTSVTNQVIQEGEEITVFKRNQPAFKIVPLGVDSTSDNKEAVAETSSETIDQEKILGAATSFIDRYESVFERLSQ